MCSVCADETCDKNLTSHADIHGALLVQSQAAGWVKHSKLAAINPYSKTEHKAAAEPSRCTVRGPLLTQPYMS
jgi:hypothetical protein